MNAVPLSISGAWLLQSQVFSDNRGTFTEWFKSSALSDQTGEVFVPRQANLSVSNAGVIRGIHYSLAPTGQAKLITVMSGSILDVAIDIRIGSPTFGKYESVTLEAGDGQTMFLRSNLAHAFQALENNTTVSYLVSSEYSPENEMEITPLCSTLNVLWNANLRQSLSSKDLEAPDLQLQISKGHLPNF